MRKFVLMQVAMLSDKNVIKTEIENILYHIIEI
jgi:hypothetical protein